MKKIGLLVFSLLLFQNICISQVDLKGGFFISIPLGLYAGGEYGVYDDIGIELGVISNPGIQLGQTYMSGTAIFFNARYYFSPRYGLDRFYTGLYLRPQTTVIEEETTNFFFPTFPSTGPSTPTSSTFEYSRDSGLGIGFMIGKKFVKKNKYFIDFNLGIGRNFGRRVYEYQSPTPLFGRGGGFDRIEIDFLYYLVFGYRL